MKTLDWKSILRRHPLFSALGEEEIERLLDDAVSEERDCPQDHVILKEGELADSIFLIGSGAARVVLTAPDGQKMPLFTLRDGEFFGEMALFERRPRSATVIAEERSLLLEINGHEFLKLTHDHPDVAFQVLLKLSERLRHVDERLLAVRVNDVDEKIEAFKKELAAKLEVVDVSMKAAQTVFEQTNTRANEIIESADRSRTRLTAAASAIGVVIAALLSVFAFFGYSQLQDAEEIRKSADRAKADAQDIAETKGILDTVREEVDQFKVLSYDFYKEVMVRRFAEEVETNVKSAKKTYKVILKLEDRLVTDELFRIISRGVISGRDIKLNTYREILGEGIDKKYVQTPRQAILSYYLLSAVLIVDDRFQEYDGIFVKFKDYVTEEYAPKYEAASIKQSLEEKFDPEIFKEAIDALNSDSETSNLKKSKIDEVWNQIP